jgi:hypothetical protein
MHVGARKHLACAVLCALVAASSAQQDTKRAAEGPPRVKAEAADNTNRNQYPTNDSPLPVRVIESPSDAADRKTREADAAKHEQDDLRAQVRAADAAEKQVAVGVRQADSGKFVVNPGNAPSSQTDFDLEQGVKALYQWGEIRYEDGFCDDRRTWFRLRLLLWDTPNGERFGIWTYCDEGNNAT